MLNGEEFYYYYDGDNLCTVLKLADNSSWLEFSDWGFVNSLINRVDLQNKYNGGMCLGNFNYSDDSEIVSNLKSLSNSFSIAPTLVGLISSLADSSMYVTGGAVGSVLMPYVLFALCVAQISLLLDPDCCVGEPDGYVDNFYVTHPNWTIKVANELVQIKKNNNNYRNLNLNDIKEAYKDKEFYLDGTSGDPDPLWKVIPIVCAVAGARVLYDLSFLFKSSRALFDDSNFQNFSINLKPEVCDSKITMTFNISIRN